VGPGERRGSVTVFVVMSGENWDRGIEKIFSTRELAELYVSVNAGVFDGPVQICEWKLDENEEEWRSGLLPFHVHVFGWGEVRNVERTLSPCGSGWIGKPGMRRTGYGHAYYRFLVWARDAEQAKQIAAERREKMLAAGEWPEGPSDLTGEGAGA
jgi:hypothetical protein